MSYQVLARKWRPGTFHEMVGQEHVLRALINGLDSDRLHHAYLFTGTRGVGKTSVARILAKCLNCEVGVSSTPCGECSACIGISEGRFVDLIEVDAASRTKVEDTRELLDNVQYAPGHGRFKVYLIDEVHMLSGNSFNALLKTLEEPPPHVKFLLATTDPQKLPATILSRCLQFSLKNLAPEVISKHLQHVLTEEAVSFEEPALWHIARAAAGSMRDALSLSDQAIAFGGGSLGEAEVRIMLGAIDRHKVFELLEAIHSGDGAAMLETIAALAELGPDYEALLAEMQAILHELAVLQAVPDYKGKALEHGEILHKFAGSMRAEDVQLYYQTALLGLRDMPYAPDPRSGFEMTLLRMLAFAPDSLSHGDPTGDEAGLKKIQHTERTQPAQDRASVARVSAAAALNSASSSAATSSSATPTTTVTSESASSARPLTVAAVPNFDKPPHKLMTPTATRQAAPQTAAAEPVITTPGPSNDPVLPAVTVLAADAENWNALYKRLSLSGMAKNVAANCVLTEKNATHVQLVLDEANCRIFKPAHEVQIQQALQDILQAEVKVSISGGAIAGETPYQIAERERAERQQQAVDSIFADPNVQQLIEKFDAQVMVDSIVPIDREPAVGSEDSLHDEQLDEQLEN